MFVHSISKPTYAVATFGPPAVGFTGQTDLMINVRPAENINIRQDGSLLRREKPLACSHALASRHSSMMVASRTCPLRAGGVELDARACDRMMQSSAGSRPKALSSNLPESSWSLLANIRRRTVECVRPPRRASVAPKPAQGSRRDSWQRPGCNASRRGALVSNFRDQAGRRILSGSRRS
jgi:hypothetical protein